MQSSLPVTSNNMKRSSINPNSQNDAQSTASASTGSTSPLNNDSTQNTLIQTGALTSLPTASSSSLNQSDNPPPEKRSFILTEPALKLDIIASAVSSIFLNLYANIAY